MHRAQALIAAFLVGLPLAAAPLAAAPPVQPAFSGTSALAFTRRLVDLGPRPPGSVAHQASQKLILGELKKSGCTVEQDTFTATTPVGPKPMNNIIAKIPGKSGRVLAVSGHYDTKLMANMRFVGANDGGSSAGFLLEMARVLCGRPSAHDVWLIWFDGEEAFREWTDEDSLYGSRRIAARWRQDGTVHKLLGIINVDMIGDADLFILNDMNSTEWLRRIIWRTASELGYSRHFDSSPGGITDDHIPFLQIGAAAVDLIDFNYGAGNANWHTERDTVDKLSPRSFQVVGDVVLQTLRTLMQREKR